jgi:hypothetical protein
MTGARLEPVTQRFIDDLMAAGGPPFAQSPTAIAAAWRDIISLIMGGSVKPIVERDWRSMTIVGLSPVASLSKTFWCFSVLINHFLEAAGRHAGCSRHKLNN